MHERIVRWLLLAAAILMNEMTPRERWLAILNHQLPDRLPTDYWATTEFHAKFKRALGCADDETLLRRLGIDRPRSVSAQLKPDRAPQTSNTNIWGVRKQRMDYGSGVYDETAMSPLADFTTVQLVHEYAWPSPDDFDYAPIRETLAKDDGYRIVRGGHFEPFLIYCEMRGMEQAYEDLLVSPEIADSILQHLFDFHYEYNRRLFEAGSGKIDLMYIAEDLGGQTGPLFSMEVFRRFLLPNQKKMADLARAYGVHVMYHTDGAARAFLPDLVEEVGIEILNPLQWRCPGMELEGLARDYGKRVAFHGGIDNQQTLPFGTPDDVRAEVRCAANTFRDCRWICAPCHNIQSITPVENVVALYEAAQEFHFDGMSNGRTTCK